VWEISIPIVEALPIDRTSGIHFMTIHCVAVDRGGLIKIKKEEESSWVKRKTFPTDVGRPN